MPNGVQVQVLSPALDIKPRTCVLSRRYAVFLLFVAQINCCILQTFALYLNYSGHAAKFKLRKRKSDFSLSIGYPNICTVRYFILTFRPENVII